ncbi:FAS-associated death domain protein [Antennarius striatus]|uniref:FAS-associated death domain protein n=1 Tax=Antennarius striatus TaxID=241820 RepID=UPI0035B0FDA1
MSSFRFNAVLLSISDELSPDELSKLKFLCVPLIRKRDRESIDTGSKLFQKLTETGSLAPDRTERLSELLAEIRRPDLVQKLTQFRTTASHPDNQPDERERARLDVATEVVSQNLGRQWRKLGRKLGLSEPKLESVSQRHPTDLEETAVELLKEWRRLRGAQAQTDELLGALRACEYNLTADKVEDRLAEQQK